MATNYAQIAPKDRTKSGDTNSPSYLTVKIATVHTALTQRSKRAPILYFEGALNNILKFSFWLNSIYQVKCDC